MKLRLVLLFAVLASPLAFGQVAKASMSPKEVTAGQNITITIKLDQPLSDRASLRANYGPKDNNQSTNMPLNPTADPLVYTNTGLVPANAQGIWEVKDVLLFIPASTEPNPILDTDHPDFKVKPIENKFPAKGKVTVTVP
jgi:hypothetical protein